MRHTRRGSATTWLALNIQKAIPRGKSMRKRTQTVNEENNPVLPQVARINPTKVMPQVSRSSKKSRGKPSTVVG